eukprot:jgi/Botrbrau1/14303/Bobra.0207s0008.1
MSLWLHLGLPRSKAHATSIRRVILFKPSYLLAAACQPTSRSRKVSNGTHFITLYSSKEIRSVERLGQFLKKQLSLAVSEDKMGKKKAPARLSPSNPPTLPPPDTVTEELTKLKTEGSKQFTRKEYAKAADTYEKALRTLAGTIDAKEERAQLHSNKAACLMMQQRFKEAVNECTSALEALPGYSKALVRRAKAYENMGHYKQALSDIQKANKADSPSAENVETEKRLKDIVSGKRPGTIATSTANGALTRRGSTKGRHPLVFMAKVSLGDEVRQMHLMATTTYAELLEAVRAKFPNAPPFAIKYVDREGDLVTIVDKMDLGRAVAEVYEAAERVSGGAHGPRLPHNLMPALRLTLQPVASQEDVPKPPADELAAMEQNSLARRILRGQAASDASAQANGNKDQTPQEVEVEQWVLDFAALFREQLGVDHDRPLDLQAHAWEQLQSALDMSVRDDRSLPLFDKAAARFQEMSAQGMLQWGNVLMLKGKRLVDKAVAEGKSMEDSVQEASDSSSRLRRSIPRASASSRALLTGQLLLQI